MIVQRLDIEIELNRISQRYISEEDGLNWFESFAEASQREILRILIHAVLQAHVTPADVVSAIQETGLRPTCAPCALLMRGAVNIQLAKAVQLPKEELGRLFKLLIGMLRIADSRRRLTCGSECKHWWHMNLRDPEIILEIKKRYCEGIL